MKQIPLYLIPIEGKMYDEKGIRTPASEETGALNQRLRPLGHLTTWLLDLPSQIRVQWRYKGPTEVVVHQNIGL